MISVVLWLLPTIALSQVPVARDNVASASASGTQYVLQVGAFGDSANAARLSEDLRDKGYPTVIKDIVNDAGATLTHVFAGPFSDQGAALAAQSALENEGVKGFVRPVAVRTPQPTARPLEAPTSPKQPQDVRSGRSPANLAKDQEQLLARAQQDMFEVPPVVERPLGMEEGPRVVVSRFELTGAVTREKEGISVSDLNVILNGHVQSQPADGYTISQLQAIADEITRHYRDRGFILAQAIVPAQTVVDGVVGIKVMEGSLEDVIVEGNRIYNSKRVSSPFRSLQGRPVTQSSIERALLDVQDFPGLQVFGTFTQGDEQGTTDLVVRVRDEDRAYFTPIVDNYGSEFTGEYRLMVDFSINNLFGAADRLSGYVLQTFEPDNGTYGGLNFRVPFGHNAVGFGASTNQFDVGGSDGLGQLGITGTADEANVFWDHAFANGRFFSSNARFDLAIKRADTEIQDDLLNQDKLTVASVIWDFFSAGRGGRGLNIGSIAIDVGIPDFLGSMDENGNGLSSREGGTGDNRERAGGDFAKVSFNYQHLRRISESNSILLRLDGQWTDDLLVALEQYAIGGPQNVRAYPVAEALVDIGFSSTIEWLIDAPGFSDRPVGNSTWGQVFKVAIYADYAFGERNNPLLFEEPTVDYSGYGLGLQFNVPEKVYLRFDVASPIGSREPTNDRDPQYYFRASYTF